MLQPYTHGMPDLKAADAARLGDSAWLLPTDGSFVMLGIVECLLCHSLAAGARQYCKRAARRTVLAIGAQYKTLMNVMYQTPHGQPSSSSQSAGQVALQSS